MDIHNIEKMLRCGCDRLADPDLTIMQKHKTLQVMEGLCRSMREHIEHEFVDSVDNILNLPPSLRK